MTFKWFTKEKQGRKDEIDWETRYITLISYGNPAVIQYLVIIYLQVEILLLLVWNLDNILFSHSRTEMDNKCVMDYNYYK